MHNEEIRERIARGLPGSVVTVSGNDGTHFQAVVVYPGFDGKGTLQRHKMVYATLGEAVGREIHALSLRTLTPSEAGDSGPA